MSDKARFYLEQGLPELQELERKKIFTKEEIHSISRKRSHYEHRIAAARCKPADFLAYATYEMNLDALRHKRMKRLAVRMKGSANHLGSRRIFFIFQRATRKFHGDIHLWKTYVEFCRAQKSHGLLRKILGSMLRLHPTKPDLWVYAAKIALDDTSNMAETRSYLQRGLRFCRHTKELWVEYAKFECIFIGRIATAAANNTRILGAGDEEGTPDPNGLSLDDVEEDSSVTLEGDEIMLPTITEAELNGEEEEEEEGTGRLGPRAVEHPNKQVLEGVIPLIVFDEAVSAIPGDPSLPVSFFGLFEQFTELDCQKQLLAHVDSHLITAWPRTATALLCNVREPLVGVPVTDASFPVALRAAFKRFGEARAKCEDKKALYDGFVKILHGVLRGGDTADGGLDQSLEKAVRLFFGKIARWSQEDQLELEDTKQIVSLAL